MDRSYLKCVCLCILYGLKLLGVLFFVLFTFKISFIKKYKAKTVLIPSISILLLFFGKNYKILHECAQGYDSNVNNKYLKISCKI